MTKTMRKVTIVVPVLMTSCHVSLKWKIGPVMAHTITTRTASTSAHGVPTACVTRSDAARNRSDIEGRSSSRCLLAMRAHEHGLYHHRRWLEDPPKKFRRRPCPPH